MDSGISSSGIFISTGCSSCFSVFSAALSSFSASTFSAGSAASRVSSDSSISVFSPAVGSSGPLLISSSVTCSIISSILLKTDCPGFLGGWITASSGSSSGTFTSVSSEEMSLISSSWTSSGASCSSFMKSSSVSFFLFPLKISLIPFEIFS